MRFESAAGHSLASLAQLLNRAYAGYAHNIQSSAETLARFVRLGTIDLGMSLVLLQDEQPAGLALVGMRGSVTRVAAFGVAAELRGRGLAGPLCEATLAVARSAGASSCLLEVLRQNERAIRTYSRAGFVAARRLHILERPGPHAMPSPGRPDVDRFLARNFARLHFWRPAWQRDLAQLLAVSGQVLLPEDEPAQPGAYAFLDTHSVGLLNLHDLACVDVAAARRLCVTLGALPSGLRVTNEPEDSPFAALLPEHGFAPVDEQLEMVRQL